MTPSPAGPVPMPYPTTGAAVKAGWVTYAEAGEPQAAIEVYEVKWGARVATEEAATGKLPGMHNYANVTLKRGVVAERGKRHVELRLRDVAGGTTVLRGAQVVAVRETGTAQQEWSIVYEAIRRSVDKSNRPPCETIELVPHTAAGDGAVSRYNFRNAWPSR